MSFQYILVGVALFHAIFALINTISVAESFFMSKSKKTWMLLLNWLIPIIGPALVYEMARNPLVKGKAVKGDIDNPGTYYANSDSGGSDCGGGGE